MTGYEFFIDPSRCIGCQACVQACTECDTHRGRSMIHLEFIDRSTTTQTDYADYRPVAGVMLPFRWTFSWLDGRDRVVLSDIQANVPIDAAKFARPVPRR